MHSKLLNITVCISVNISQVNCHKYRDREQDTRQEMRYPNVTLLNFATALAFNALDGEVPLERSP